MRSISVAFLLVANLVYAGIPSIASAQSWSKGAPDWATADDVAAEKHLRNICVAIGSRTQASNGPYRYLAIQKIVDAAGVTGEIDTLQKEQKLQATWKRFEGYLVCNNLQFDVVNGSVLKFAVSSMFSDFVEFAADNKLGLTRVDESDGKTVLDYVAERQKRMGGTAVAARLEHSYKLLRNAGAKHARELG